jgi:hypothetical protein
VHMLQRERKTLQTTLQHKDEVIDKLEKELCNLDKEKNSHTQADVPPSSPSSRSEDSGHDVSSSSTDPADHTSTVDLNELSLAEQVEDLRECARRSSSRLSYLNTRLTAKDENIQKLQNRIEEVISERDSFREALQMSFVAPPDATPPASQSSVIRSSSDPAIISSKLSDLSGGSSCLDSHGDSDDDIGDKGETETKSSPPRPSMPKNQETNPLPSKQAASSNTATATSSTSTIGGASVLGNWHSTMSGLTTGLTSDGFKGLGSYLYTQDAGSGGNLSGTELSHHHKQYIKNLEKKLQILQLKNKKMAELKSLIPVVEDLKEKVQKAEEASKETDKWADEEFTVLTKKMDEMRQLRKEAVVKYQQSQQEVEDLKQQMSRTASTYSKFEEKLEEKVRRIQTVEKELRTTQENSVDLATHQKVQDRINTLMGESKHWQQKAQSLSKEMHRSMSLQMDYNKKKDEILMLQKKIEVCNVWCSQLYAHQNYESV